LIDINAAHDLTLQVRVGIPVTPFRLASSPVRLCQHYSTGACGASLSSHTS
jgi:hypothetical protein